MFLVRVLNQTPIMRWFRTARGLRDQYVDPQVRRLRTVIREMKRGEIDILFLGDSSSTFFGQDDADHRRLPEMLEAELGRRVTVLAGPGYSPELYAEFVRLLATLPQRPKAVVLTRAVRICYAVHVREHPEYGYRRSVETLRRVPDAQHHLRAFDRRNRRTPADMEGFRALPVTTRWGRASTVGAFLDQVRGRRGGPEVLERQQALFDYFHGEPVTPDHPELVHLRTLAERLHDYGVPVVHYWPPIPVHKGEQYFPGEFAGHVQTAYDVCRAPFEEVLGEQALLVESPFETPDDEFIDSADGSEHWNDRGRLRIARRIAELVRDGGL